MAKKKKTGKPKRKTNYFFLGKYHCDDRVTQPPSHYEMSFSTSPFAKSFATISAAQSNDDAKFSEDPPVVVASSSSSLYAAFKLGKTANNEESIGRRILVGGASLNRESCTHNCRAII